ncbi:enoyl-CoA hydratase/isomerase family protein [Sediminibacillus albus]|uniref:2-(1,2-epoxy-1,2-dihydrophenyl)acetyl-CoA isomerase n=1 Tax=Sediminibacillus albus TaxID=407036 RepID=A0A1G8VT75_9BACI|nr:enoyl-CoA hydratase/isomerase family protein [Sediminibacillus albus]SDJ69242.1 2-(1,2-epoxy-1,2-dihydrophenyl)acetyl-CoA isomerase [Sediminibacillus albus]
MESQIITAIDNHIAHLKFNRPKQLNSLSPEFIEELIDQLKKVENDKRVKVIILSGSGKAFSSGGDLSTMGNVDHASQLSDYMERASQLTKTIVELEKYVIAAVHGYAAGAGFSLAMACDFLVADKTAKFAMSFQQVGLIPDLGLLKLLSSRIPSGTVKEWAATGKVLSAEEGFSRGFVNRLSNENVYESARLFAEPIINGPSQTDKYIKYLLNHTDIFSLGTALQEENRIQCSLLQTEDHREGVQAFLEKRKPRFSGM